MLPTSTTSGGGMPDFTVTGIDLAVIIGYLLLSRIIPLVAQSRMKKKAKAGGSGVGVAAVSTHRLNGDEPEGVEPTNELATGQNADDLRHLVEHSTDVGALDPSYSAQLAGALDLQSLTVRDLIRAGARPTAVPSHASVEDVRAAILRG